MTTRLVEIVKRRGAGDLLGAAQALIPGPGHSDRDRSLSLLDTAARIVFNDLSKKHAPREVFAYLESLGVENASKRPLTVAERKQFAKDRAKMDAARAAHVAAKREQARVTWNESMPAEPGGVVRRWLNYRGISDATAALAVNAGVLREHRDTYGRFAMVALVQDAFGALQAIQTTKLRADGCGKRGDLARISLGPIKGGAVRLLRPHDGAVAICEGVEDALAFYDLHRIPAWAALGTAMVEAFVPPPSINTLYIATDADDAGRACAEALFDRLRERVRCVIATPDCSLGKDWCDVLAAKAREGARNVV